MNACRCQLQKRCWPVQQPRREAERQARVHAVGFGNWALEQGFSHPMAAQQLGLPLGTLAYWAHRSRVDDLEARRLGRPCQRGRVRLRNEAIDFMRCVGAGVTAVAVVPVAAALTVEVLPAAPTAPWLPPPDELPPPDGLPPLGFPPPPEGLFTGPATPPRPAKSSSIFFARQAPAM